MKLAETHSRHCQQVVLLVILNVRNAFNSTRLYHMLEALENRFVWILKGCLEDRTLLYETRERQNRMKVTSGTVQVFRTLEPLLPLETPDESLGYADEVATLVTARTVE